MWDIFSIYAERKDFFIKLLLEHIRISASAIFMAALIGIVIGILISGHKRGAGIILGIVNIVYTIPSISLLGFLIPLTGIGNKTAIIALTVYGLLPMVRNTYTGINNIDSKIIEAAKGLGSTKFQILLKIRLPLAFPVVLSGFRNMIVMVIALSGIASFIGAGGLGVAVYRGITTYNMTLTMAGSILIALVALISDGAIGIVEKIVRRRWKL